MAYQVLARKWRPQTFAEVVGQEHIGRTLRNAIIQNRIGHAYLFVGSRGIGKTTSARIFAKALNCRNPLDGEPCCECDNCIEIAQGNSLDVIEIDGASHNKVEDIREIRESVHYSPGKSKFKIYIIDEVHMLTNAAWNALLKTLEEPPAHVKFLFATTEPHKVLPTIISRCQRFDLKRIPVPLIVQRLRQIADSEKIFVEDQALAVIARAADGGMRDAQSILDQMIAFCGGMDEANTIGEQEVIEVFGIASGVELRELALAVIANDLDRMMFVLQAVADSGRDLERLFEDFIGYVRNIMLASLCKDASKFLQVSSSELVELQQLGSQIDGKLLQGVLQGLIDQEWNFRTALNKRIYLEVVLCKVMSDAHSVRIDDVLTQLNVMSGILPKEQMPQVSKTIILPEISEEFLKRTTEQEVSIKLQSPSMSIAESKQETEADSTVIESETVAAVDATVVTTPEAEAVAPPKETAPQVPELRAEIEKSAPTPASEIVSEASNVTPFDDETVESSVESAAVAQEAPVVLEIPAVPEVPESTEGSDTLLDEILSDVVAPVSDTPSPSDNLLEEILQEEDTFDEVSTAYEEEVPVFEGKFIYSAEQLLQALLNELMKENPPRDDLRQILAACIPEMNEEQFLQLSYDQRKITENDVRLIIDERNQRQIKAAFTRICPLGQVQIKRWNPAEREIFNNGMRQSSLDELDQLAKHPFVERFNQALGSTVIDARVPEE